MRSIISKSSYIFIIILVWISICPAKIILNPDGYFEAPGFAFLVYHNKYIGGRQGGLQMILHGKRVLDAGTIYCTTRTGKRIGYHSNEDKEVGERIIDINSNTVMVPGRIVSLDIHYNLIIQKDGDAIRITVKLDNPIDWSKVADFKFKIELYPEEYQNKTFNGGGVSSYFWERGMYREELIPKANEIQIAPEDSLKSIRILAKNADLSLFDERRDLRVSGYMVFATLPVYSKEQEFSIEIIPKIDPSWRRAPVIQISQLGYHPAQQKVAVIELDTRTEIIAEVLLVHLEKNGRPEVVKKDIPVKWGSLFNYIYYTFDFTEITAQGQYFIRYDTAQVGPFLIEEGVYDQAWYPTLDIFFPVQMCHVKVSDFLNNWHGACHLDDALQAPPNKNHIDGYRQGASTESRFKENEHIPDLNWGGWHDAGDFDLATGSQCQTLLWLALAQEEFNTTRDVTTISRALRQVDLYEPDGKNDLLQQISYGVELLLAMYRQIGHIPTGIIANVGPLYGVFGDPGSVTDGLIYDPELKPGEQKHGRSGKFDDRWLFTTRNTGGQYQFVQTAAICARVLREFDEVLAEDCLQAALNIWHFEQTHPSVNFTVAYQPQEDANHSWEIAAAAELLLTTGRAEFEEKLLSYIPSIQAMSPLMFGQGIGFTLVRVLEKMPDTDFSKTILDKSEQFLHSIAAEFAKSPYDVYLHFDIWGNNWSVLEQTARLYYFIKNLPQLFDAEHLYSALHYNFGRHPATNHSYVSGVGSKSATIGYGFNRAEKTYIPGGVVSGASLIRPKFPEYRSRAWDWYQTEYVIGGSAAYVFDVLAAAHLLKSRN